MATVTIGGRALDVRPSSLGFLRNTLLPWKARVREATTDEQVVDLQVEILMVYLGHNEGVNAEWLLANVPEEAGETVAACMAAARGKAEPAGEAKSP